MIISFILSAMMLAALSAGLAVRRRAPIVGVAIAIAAAAGLYFVWMPDHLSAVANAMGVGRGTDLLLYLWVSLTMLAFAGIVLELRHLRRQLTLLARELALQRVRGDASVRSDTAILPGDQTASSPLTAK
jgi:small membrane protein